METEGRIGVASTNDFSKDGARAAAASALEMALVAAPDPMHPGMAPKADVPEKPDAYDEATASTTPERRAEAVATLVGQVGEGFRAAGAFETTAAEVALANTEGQFCYAPYTRASVSTVVSGGDGGAGTAEVAEPRAGDLDPEAVGSNAFRKARDSQNPRDVDAGRFEVVLEPMAVDTLVAFLAYIGFGGRAIAEGRSPFSGKQGQQVCDPSVHVYDDALAPDTLGLPFDFEGTPKRRLFLIEGGVFRTGAFDRRTAKMAGTQTTGHALPPPNPAVAKSASAFSTHSRVPAFIERLTLFEDLRDEIVVHRQPLPDRLRAANDQVHREAGADAFQNLGCLDGRVSLVWHDDQQVHVGILIRLPVGIRSEEHDALRTELTHHFVHERLDFVSPDHHLSPSCGRDDNRLTNSLPATSSNCRIRSSVMAGRTRGRVCEFQILPSSTCPRLKPSSAKSEIRTPDPSRTLSELDHSRNPNDMRIRRRMAFASAMADFARSRVADSPG